LSEETKSGDEDRVIYSRGGAEDGRFEAVGDFDFFEKGLLAFGCDECSGGRTDGK
jgi:hypothetical protein